MSTRLSWENGSFIFPDTKVSNKLRITHLHWIPQWETSLRHGPGLAWEAHMRDGGKAALNNSSGSQKCSFKLPHKLKDAGKYWIWDLSFSHYYDSSLASQIRPATYGFQLTPRPGLGWWTLRLSFPIFHSFIISANSDLLKGHEMSYKKRPLCFINGSFRNLLIRSFPPLNREVGSFN